MRTHKNLLAATMAVATLVAGANVLCTTTAQASSVNFGAYIDVRQTFIGGDVIYMTDPITRFTGKTRDYYDTGVGTQYKQTDQDGTLTIYEGRSWASADLATGKLRGLGYGGYFGGGFDASLVDRVYFDTEGSLDPFTVSFDAYFHGSFSDDAQVNFSIALQDGFSSVSTLALYRQGGTAENPGSIQYVNTNEIGGAFTQKGTTKYSGYITLDPRSVALTVETMPFLDIVMGISGGGSFVDVANTAGLTISSPYSYTSASGVFLTDTSDVSEVPTPAALPLLASALIGFGVIARRKRKANAAG